ncbi:MAG: ABC transporter ATP-binding protein [Christensenellales bacterium]|jgi:putative ABC transport system ATP-binding protein
MIDIKNVSKIYKMGEEHIRALDDVSLSVKEGEFVAVTGPSGSGKSTLMNIIGCLDVPDSGSYALAREDISKLSDNELSEVRNKRIGFIFQQFNLIPKLNAYENVELPLIYQGIAGGRRRDMTLKALEQVGLSQRAKHKPSELSGGQQQRVAVARALATDPAIILADEPTGNLDSKSGREILALIEQLNALGKTVVMITHDDKVAAGAKRRVAMHDGRIVFDGIGGGVD